MKDPFAQADALFGGGGSTPQGASGSPSLLPPTPNFTDTGTYNGMQTSVGVGSQPAAAPQGGLPDFNQLIAPGGLDAFNKSLNSAPQGKSVGGFFSNLASSVGNLASGIGNAVIHPIKTVGSILSLGAGAAEEAAGTLTGQKINTDQTAMFDNLVKFFGDRYGGKDVGDVLNHIGETAYKDPAGFLLDLSTVLSGGGAALGKIGEVGNVAKLSDVGNVLSKAGEFTNPIALAGKGIGAVATKVGGEGVNAADIALGATTGKGAGVMPVARQASEAFTSALRGEWTPQQTVDEINKAVASLKATRSAEVQADLAKLKGMTTKIDVQPIIDNFNENLKKFNIKVTPGGLDFGDTGAIGADSGAQKNIQALYDRVQGLEAGAMGVVPGEAADARTALSVDRVKQMANAMWSPSGTERAFTTDVANTISKTIGDQVPGYLEKNAKYSTFTDQIEAIQKGLSAGTGASYDAVFKKLTSIYTKNNAERAQLLSDLEKVSGKDLSGMIAGNLLHSPTAGGLTGLAEGGIGITQIAQGGLAILTNPGMIIGMASASPRVVGEFMRVLGLSEKLASKFLTAAGASSIGSVLTPRIPAILKAGYYSQAGQTPTDQGQTTLPDYNSLLQGSGANQNPGSQSNDQGIPQ